MSKKSNKVRKFFFELDDDIKDNIIENLKKYNREINFLAYRIAMSREYKINGDIIASDER